MTDTGGGNGDAKGCGKCRHPALCRAQGEGFCLVEYNEQRHREYLERKREQKSGGGKEE